MSSTTMATEPAAIMARLDQLARGLDDDSKALSKVEAELEPLESFIEEHEDDFMAGLWNDHDSTGAKLPPEAIRESLCRKDLPADIRSQHATALARRRRLEKRIKHLTTQVDAQRSLLSAAKAEMEAVG